MKQSKDRPKTG